MIKLKKNYPGKGYKIRREITIGGMRVSPVSTV
jgi:hypothetical protein